MTYRRGTRRETCQPATALRTWDGRVVHAVTQQQWPLRAVSGPLGARQATMAAGQLPGGRRQRGRRTHWSWCHAACKDFAKSTTVCSWSAGGFPRSPKIVVRHTMRRCGHSTRPRRDSSQSAPSSVLQAGRPHRIRCKSAPRGAAREMWHRGSGAHMRSRGRNAATAAGGAWVGPNWWRSAVELRSFARRDHLVVALAARRRAGHAPLSQGGCPRWALLEVAPRFGVGGCCGSAARATEARPPVPKVAR